MTPDPVKLLELGHIAPARDTAPDLVSAYQQGYRLKQAVPRGSSVLFILEHKTVRPTRRLPRPVGPKPSEIDNAALLRAFGGVA